ncbi:MAG TPA: ZIP family metal transporter [Syntrophomonadaceae bacterium]|nr:ZIP family metal transporter [Syntrophomonadaceae bacterium]
MDFPTLMIISLAAGLCTLAGALSMFMKRNWSDRSLSLFLGLAAGVMTAVILFDMLPSALAYSQWKSTLAGAAAGILFMLLNHERLTGRFANAPSITSLGYVIMVGIAIHDLPEGIAIALGAELQVRTAWIIALGISLHNIPEGMAIAAPLLVGQVPRRRILLQILLVALVTPLGTFCGKMLIDLLPGLMPGMLGLACGIMAFIVLVNLWPEARIRDERSCVQGFWLGVIIIFLATFV